MGLMKAKRQAEPPEITSKAHMISQNLVGAMYQCIDRLNDNSIPMNEMEVFCPSFTPLRSYVTQLIFNSHYDIPNILKTKFSETKVGFMTKPDLSVFFS